MNNINEVIRRSGLRKNWIAEKMGVHKSLISIWIAGDRIPNSERIRSLCKTLNCKVKDLFPDCVPKGVGKDG